MLIKKMLKRWYMIPGIVILIFCISWIACTQMNPMNPTGTLQENLSILTSILANPLQIAVGGAQSIIRARLVNENGDPLVNEIVTFSTNLGSVTTGDSTDNDGWAIAVLTSEQAAGTAIVTAYYGDLTPVSISVRFISSSQSNMQIEARPGEILANGIDVSNITVTLLSDSAQPIVDAAVDFALPGGTATALTDRLGEAVVSLTSMASASDTIVTVRATYDSLSVAVPVTLKGVQLTAGANPVEIRPDGESVSTITVILKETVSHIAISNARIGFGTDLGTIPNETTTNSQGIAMVNLKSEATVGTAHVIVFYGNTITDTVEVVFSTEPQTTHTLTQLTATRGAILANGEDQSAISARIVDNFFNPVSGAVINFSSTVGDIPDQGVTDDNGYAIVVLTSVASVTDHQATVTARLDTQALSVTVFFLGVEMGISASPTLILADGESVSTITILLKKATSRVAISGAKVTFGTNLGTISSEATTDLAGVARVTLTSSMTVGTAQVVATYGSTIEDTVEVEFSTEAPSIHTLSATTASTNTLLANGIDRSAISARVIDDAQNSVEGVVVRFSTTAGTIPTLGITNANGYAIVNLTSVASNTDITATVTAELSTQTLQTNVDFEGVTLECSASPLTIIANGQSTSMITAVLKRTTNKVAISGAMITFGADLGTIPSLEATNSAGMAQVTLTSETTTGTAQVTIRYGATVEGMVQVTFQASVPTYIEISAIPSVIPADGQSQSVIKATLTDGNRNPVPDGTAVVFDIAEGSGTIGSYRETVSGIATSVLTSSTFPDTAKVTVTSGSLSDTIMVYYTVGEADRILVSTDQDVLPADGYTTATIEAKVLDAQGHPLEGVAVNFSATIGDVTQTAATNSQGIASVQFSSSDVGIATITAQVVNLGGNSISGVTSIQLTPGDPNTILLWFDPTSMGVKETGQNQTVTCFARVKDDKNNPVQDGTYVLFTIYHGPGGGEFLSPVEPIPTVNGVAHVSFSSGIRSGAARIQAEVTDELGTPLNPSVKAISTELIIHAGPPYIEDIDDQLTTHLTVASERLNICASQMETSVITVLVGDKYNNPVQGGTAVYLTTSGGVMTTHTAYTNENGVAQVLLQTGNPQPTIDRFYNYIGLQDPNTGVPIGDHITDPLIPDFENSRVENSEGDFGENDGIARIMAYTEGVDMSNNSARAWDWGRVVFSTVIAHFELLSDAVGDTLAIGESTTIYIELWDVNGNPIVGGSTLTTSVFPTDAQVGLEWGQKLTMDPGSCYYSLTIVNSVDPEKPQFAIIGAYITIAVASVNGNVESTIGPFYMDIPH